MCSLAVIKTSLAIRKGPLAQTHVRNNMFVTDSLTVCKHFLAAAKTALTVA